MLKTAEKVVDVSVQLKTARESLTMIQNQLINCKKLTLKSVVKTGIAASMADCKKVQDLENEYMKCLKQINTMEGKDSSSASQLLSISFIMNML